MRTHTDFCDRCGDVIPDGEGIRCAMVPSTSVIGGLMNADWCAPCLASFHYWRESKKAGDLTDARPR